MSRLLTAVAAALAFCAVTATGVGAAGKSPNAGTIEFICDGFNGPVWVNFVASDVGSENPALVLDGDGRVLGVFKATGYDSDNYGSGELRFPAPDPPFETVTCTHEDGIGGYVYLQGVFIPRR